MGYYSIVDDIGYLLINDEVDKPASPGQWWSMADQALSMETLPTLFKNTVQTLVRICAHMKRAFQAAVSGTTIQVPMIVMVMPAPTLKYTLSWAPCRAISFFDPAVLEEVNGDCLYAVLDVAQRGRPPSKARQSMRSKVMQG